VTGVERIDLLLEPLDVPRQNGRSCPSRPRGARELGLDDEQLVLEAPDGLPDVRTALRERGGDEA